MARDIIAEIGETHAEAMMLYLYACTNLKKHLAVGEKYCHSGMSSVNYGASNCSLISVWEGQKGTFQFVDGEIVARQIEPIQGKESWTEITIKPSADVFPGLQFTSQGIAERAAAIREESEGLNLIVEDRIICHTFDCT
jgi:DNA gyrase/topoisomerase IV subunit B